MRISNKAMKLLGDENSVKIISSVTGNGKPHSAVADNMTAMGKDRLFLIEKEVDALSENMNVNESVAVLIEKGTEAYLLLCTALERYTDGVFFEVMSKAECSKGTDVKAVWTFTVNEILDKSRKRSA